jgi:four helix bundle protein
VRSYRDLIARQVAFDLATQIYRATEKFPRGEEFGLRAQMRRAAVSLPSNLAEGAGRGGDRESAQFVSVAPGSLNELETRYLLAVELGFCNSETALEQTIERLYALLNGLRNSLRGDR